MLKNGRFDLFRIKKTDFVFSYIFLRYNYDYWK